MTIRELYHGADAAKMLFNIRRGGLTADSQGRLFFAEREWQNCLVHGADSETSESYVGKFRVEVPDGASLAQVPTSGNRDARILTLTPGAQVRAQILELYVRRGKAGSFEVDKISQGSIEKYLTQVRQNVEMRKQALSQLSDKWQILWNSYELNSNDHKTQLNLVTQSFVGFVVNKFNKPAPDLVIWTNAYGRLLAAQNYIRAGNVTKATAELQVARLWYLYAFNKYMTWKDGIESAATKTEVAIVASAIGIVATFVGASLVAGAATGWAGWGAAATDAAGGAGATAQTLVRISDAVANAERVIRIADAYEEEQKILEAIEEVEQAGSALGE